MKIFSIFPSVCALGIFVSGTLAFAQDIPSANQTSDPSVGVPETGNQSQLEQIAAPSVDTSTGSMSTSVRIESPPARGAAQPDLALSYSSDSAVGYAGWGWTIGVPSIERRPLSGPLNYDAPPSTPTTSWVPKDQFFYQGSRLMPVCKVRSDACGNVPEAFPPFLQGYWYFRKSEDSSFERFFLSPDLQTWIVQSKSGLTMELGRSLAPGSTLPPAIELAQAGASAAPQPYRWYVARKYDTSTDGSGQQPLNVVYYHWRALNAVSPTNTRLYLVSVYDTPRVGSSRFAPDIFAHHIELTYESSGWRLGAGNVPLSRQPPRLRVSGVDVTSAVFNSSSRQRELVRRYHFVYHDVGPRSYLDAVITEGKCAAPVFEIDSLNNPTLPATSCPKRPPTTFQYEGADGALVFNGQLMAGAVPIGHPAGDAGIDDTRPYVADINSDGLPDFVGSVIPDGGAAQASVAINSPTGPAGVLTASSVTVDPAGGGGMFGPGATGDYGMDFALGNFLSTGGINAALFFYGLLGGIYDLFAPQASPTGAGWIWKSQGQKLFPLTQGNPGAYTYPYACQPPNAPPSADGYAAGPETPYATADVDGDGYPDLVTYSLLASCNWGCVNWTDFGVDWQCNAWSSVTNSLSFAVGLRTTVKKPDGTLDLFAIDRGTTPPDPAWTSLLPPGTTYAQLIHVPIPAPGAACHTDSDCPALQACISGTTPDHKIVLGCAPSFKSAFLSEDMNGDGLLDVVSVLVPNGTPVGATFTVAYGNGDGTLQTQANGAPFPVVAPGALIFDASKVFLHDLNADGLADLVVEQPQGVVIYLNRNGQIFDRFLPSSASVPGLVPAFDMSTAQVTFADMNGSGVDDVVIAQDGFGYYFDLLGGKRPGLLTTIANGVGGTTSIQYASTTDLAREAIGAAAWHRTMPQVMHHVTSVSTSNGLPGVYGSTTTTQYTYSDPVYDPRDQRFVGFQKVRTRHVGDASDPSVVVDTTFLTGVCEIDVGAGCPAQPVDRAVLPFGGHPVLVETLDDAGHYLSTVHTTYVAGLTSAAGTDGTKGRFVWPSVVDTYLYDPSILAAGTSTVVLAEVQVPEASLSATRSVVLHGASTHLQKVTTEDRYGNVTETFDLGAVGTDQTIDTKMSWYLPPGEATGWLWRKYAEDIAAFALAGPFPDLPRHKDMSYDAWGRLRTVSSPLHGTVSLNRFDSLARPTAPSPADASVEGSNVQVAAYTYDAYGNPVTSMAPRAVGCTQVNYDPVFALVPVSSNVFTTAGAATCTGPALTNSVAYDLGFAKQSLETAPDGSWSQTAYDSFGRTQSVTKNDPSSTVLPSAKPSILVNYDDYRASASEPVLAEMTHTQTWDGVTYHSAWTFTDGLGSPLVTVKPAAASDAPALPWILSGIHARGAKGSIVDTYEPFFSTNGPLVFDFSVKPRGAFRHSQYDAFGHVLTTLGLDGRQDSEVHVHALSVDSYDALNLPASGHGAYSTTQKDGHGRAVLATVRARVGSSTSITTVQTAFAFGAAGDTASITRSSGGAAFTQNLRHDTLGRLVENREPNSSSGTKDWIYVYNDSGLLVGTSDARGCGENFAYDAAGREVSEDYSPCAPNHADYSSPKFGGMEVWYFYDGDPSSPAGVPDGHVHEILDRASETVFGYDARGRNTAVQRSLARPGVPDANPMTRYGTNAFTSTIDYDDADRVVRRGTGANAPKLLDGQGHSVVTTAYDDRGNVAAIDGSYGPLITQTQFDADSLPRLYAYGDAAGTSSAYSYDGLRRLWFSKVSRAGGWPATTPAAPDAYTDEPILENKQFVYDAVGNPTLVTDTGDAANPAMWPAGAKPVHAKAIHYDDRYHVTDVTYDYGVAGDVFKPPFAPEYAAEASGVAGADSPVPASILPTRVTHQTFDYDWMGNTRASDDDLHAFYDRSLGTITNDPVAPNRIIAARGITPRDALTVTYDPSGNVVGIGAVRNRVSTSRYSPKNENEKFYYEWDEVGRISRAVRQTASYGIVILLHVPADVTYSYDSTGARVLKAVKTADGTTTYNAEVFPTLRLNAATWDGAKYRDDETTEGVYLTAGTGAVIGRLAYSVSDPRTLSDTSRDWRVFLELQDPLGSTSFVVDKDTSELVERATYQPYGALESDYRTPRWASFREAYKFSGKEEDIEVGLAYFGGRYYAPALGRWMSVDPLALHAQKGNLNVYAYASGRVFRVTDPTGLSDGMPNWQSGGDIASTMGNYGTVDSALQNVPGMSTAMALEAQWESSDLTGSFSNGFMNSMSDPINGVSNFLGGGNVAPTFAPQANTSNVFDTLSYGAGGATGVGIATEGVGALAQGSGLSEAMSKVAGTLTTLGDSSAGGLAGIVADTRGGINPGILLGGEGAAGGEAGAAAVETGEVWNPRGGVDFGNSSHLTPVGAGQKNIVSIEYSGSYRGDYRAANIQANLGNAAKAPPGSTWHHLDDYNPLTNKGTMQLVDSAAHQANAHVGGISQYVDATGQSYRR